MTVIIPDIHQNFDFLNKITEKHKDDNFIFLGDYFDAKKDFSIKYFINNFLDLFNQIHEKSIFLVGNHDIPYFEEWFRHKYFKKYPYKPQNKIYKCSGYTRNKASKIVRKMDVLFEKLQLFHYEDGFLLSHAGIVSSDIPVFDNIENFVKQNNLNFNEWKTSPLTCPYSKYLWRTGSCRGGDSEKGGPVWLDWKREFEPIDGISQIVGHSFGDEPRENKHNYCIDCGQKNYATIENGHIEIIDI
jgi:hypothetical protein